VQVRRPASGKPGRKVFMSGKRRQNTIKTTTFSDSQGRTLFPGVARPGRMHDQTAVRTEPRASPTNSGSTPPDVRTEVDEGCRGLANEFPEQVGAPPKPMTAEKAQQSPLGEPYARREARRRQASLRGYSSSTPTPSTKYKQRRPLKRYSGRREDFTETQAAIAGLVSDSSARRATRSITGTDVVLARPAACRSFHEAEPSG
jgi:hypothetical protein